MVWHAKPHLASFPCGGLSAKVPGLNVSDAASYSNTAHPHPPLSANLLLSFTMKSTSCWLPGTVAEGNVSIAFRIPMDLRHLRAVGEGLAVAGNAGLVGLDHHKISNGRGHKAFVLTDRDNCQASYPLNSENASPFGTC